MNAHNIIKRSTRPALTLLTVVIGVLALSTSGAGAHSSRGSHATRATETLHLIGHETDSTFLDQGPTGPSLGDEIVFGGTLEREPGDRPAGRFGGTLVSITPDDSLLQATVTLQLPEGQIAIQGVLDFSKPPFVHAITGGTGAFLGAKGEFTFHDQAPGVLEMTLTLER
jgi:hypothetical protein